MYTDTIISDTKSSRGNRYAQFFTDGNKLAPFAVVYPIKAKEEAGESLKNFIVDFGIPFRMHSDNSLEQVSGQMDYHIVYQLSSCRSW
jgi:hypothetical protein